MPKKYCFQANLMQGGKQMKHSDGDKLYCGKSFHMGFFFFFKFKIALKIIGLMHLKNHI